jgi:peroxin-2
MSSTDFQAAQQRIAARRQAREASVASQPQVSPSSPLHKHLSHLPPSLNRVGRAGITLWDIMRGRSGTSPAFRVGQADAELLDEELLSLLRGQISAGLKYFGNLQEEWGEEVGLALRGVLFKVSVWDHGMLSSQRA